MSTGHTEPVFDDELIGRCYTKARRTPLVVGSVPGGAGRSLRLPGGPYTLTQLAAIVVTFVVLILTRPLWGGHGLMDAVVLLGLPFGAAFGLRHLHIDGRNPAAAAASVAIMLTGPRWGRLHGRPYKPARPESGSTAVTLTAAQEHPAPPAVGQSARPAAPAAWTDVHASGPVPSGTQALLASRRAAAAAHRTDLEY
ncbi:hypothetical protein [Streptomyces sp. NPDC000229]|uniref:hypothetical protein n=1 Tax=Streptomyces sp. NPDC000229 TaxID=3154247 RepID=UPI0033234B58